MKLTPRIAPRMPTNALFSYTGERHSPLSEPGLRREHGASTGAATMHREPAYRFTRQAWLALWLLASSGAAQAQTVYKCVDRDRHVAYQQTPCAPSQAAQRIEIEAPAPGAAPPPSARAAPAKPASRSPHNVRRAAAPRAVQSFECRSDSGALFYRHTACPSSIPRRGPRAAGANAADRVRATRIPRSDACKRMRSPGRTGREHDDDVSTYERNLGRDPCRRH